MGDSFLQGHAHPKANYEELYVVENQSSSSMEEILSTKGCLMPLRSQAWSLHLGFHMSKTSQIRIDSCERSGCSLICGTRAYNKE
jgi:hypothetical protein